MGFQLKTNLVQSTAVLGTTTSFNYGEEIRIRERIDKLSSLFNKSDSMEIRNEVLYLKNLNRK